MKKYFSIIFLFFGTLNGKGQIHLGFYAIPESNFSPGISFSPDYTYRALVLKDNNYKWIYDQRETSEHPYFGYTTGLSFKYKLNYKYFIGSGLQMASFGYRTDAFKLQDAPFDPETPIEARYKYRYNFVHLPIIITRYRYLNKFNGWMILAGAYGNFAMNGRTASAFTYSDGRTEKERASMAGLPSHLGIMAGIGYEYKSTSYRWHFEPVFRRSVLTFKNTPVKTHFYSIGVNVSVLLL